MSGSRDHTVFSAESECRLDLLERASSHEDRSHADRS
mgnify:CR=1 FL=1